MNSLKVKILGLICAIVVVIISVAAVINFQLQKQLVNSITERNTLLLTETIKNSITDAMRDGHSENVRSILARIKSQEYIKSVRIFATGGKILNSADVSEIGTVVPAEEQNALKTGNS